VTRFARPVLVALALVAVLAVLTVAALVAATWALGRLVAGFADTARSIERAWREG
jgi:hypothetical protein